MTRKQAREAALQALYSLTFADDVTREDVLDAVSPVTLAGWRGECDIYLVPAGDEGVYLEQLVLGVWQQSDELERRIAEQSKGWRLERISRIALTLMKMALFEPTAIEGVTQAVAINEAVELCKAYDSEEAAAFVNGVLGTLARQEPTL